MGKMWRRTILLKQLYPVFLHLEAAIPGIVLTCWGRRYLLLNSRQTKMGHIILILSYPTKLWPLVYHFPTLISNVVLHMPIFGCCVFAPSHKYGKWLRRRIKCPLNYHSLPAALFLPICLVVHETSGTLKFVYKQTNVCPCWSWFTEFWKNSALASSYDK